MDLAIHVSGGFIRDCWYLVPQSALHYTWNCFLQQSSSFRLIYRIGWLLAGLICPLKCISGGASGFAVDLLYFTCGSTFGLYGSLYVGLDCLV